MTKEKTLETLKAKGQTHLLAFWDELDEQRRQTLLCAIDGLDWSFLSAFEHPEDLSGEGSLIEPIDGLSVADIQKRKKEFETLGIQTLKDGKVALVLLAGGQGTRLGFDGPKGAYDIGLTKPLYIFEQQMKNLACVTQKVGAYPMLCVMTSDKNHEQTQSFWKEHGCFGYPSSRVKFFKQEMCASVDLDGKVLLEEKHLPALSPNGNGGWFESLKKSGLYQALKDEGVEWINVYAVDNVLQRIADPVFIGATVLAGVNCGAKVVCKNTPEERVGVLCLQDKKPSVIEYYELTNEMANERTPSGELAYRHGVILNYLFRMQTLDEQFGKEIPVHVVKKKIPYVSESGEKIEPSEPNGYKFETLVVDLVAHMGSVLPFEVVREKEFAPIKNKTGTDSVESARALLKLNGVEL